MNPNVSFKLFHIMQFNGIKRRKLHDYLVHDFYLEKLDQYSPNELQAIFHLHPEQANSFHLYLKNPNIIEKNFENYTKFQPLTIFDDEYPVELMNIPDAPLMLYWKGNKDLLKTKKISVIGTRKPSQFAADKINIFLEPIIEQNITIISGLAYGIDAMAHQYAIKHHGQTIAILGFGFNHIYPVAHTKLFHQIVDQGLILSEYHPQMRAQKWHFPERNRIISGISLATLIIEASERSGTMITADQALEQGKDVFVIPDSIFLEQAQGCLKLIQEGAIPLVKPDEITLWLKEKNINYTNKIS